MSKEIKIENITLNLSNDGNTVVVRSNRENIILPRQSIDTVAELIMHNFNVVINHYKSMIDKGSVAFDFNDINFISISIALHYLYMYNSWRAMYKKQENRDLKFIEKDFNNPSTRDIVFNYFKANYPNDWEEKCAGLLGMEFSALEAYYKTREDFYNK